MCRSMSRLDRRHTADRPVREIGNSMLPLYRTVLLLLLMCPLAARPVDFRQEVLPILSDACFHCHGPDAATRKARLRLDTREGLFRTKDGLTVVSAGHPDLSELIIRISSHDDEEIMPPREAKRSLGPTQIDILRRWVEQGAPWEGHWAFERLPADLALRENRGIGSEIDYFIVERLMTEKRSLSPEADRGRLLRRVTFDLTGLPPTIDEIRSFRIDQSSDAYERVVDRLLASTRFGERMASEWMDLARFADTHGYQMDRPREMWPWRDWVIQAFNSNVPYDQFVTEQLAGDLLPRATKQQRLATAFNRLHNQNEEGGIVEEEYRQAYVADRLNTFGTAFLGLTLDCARCHDHKYDPISQKDFYSLAAFFQNIDEAGQLPFKEFADSMPVPTMLLTTEEQDRELVELRSKEAAIEKEIQTLTQKESVGAFENWLRDKGSSPKALAGMTAFFDFEGLETGKLPNRVDPSKSGKLIESPELVQSTRGLVGELNGENGFVIEGVGEFSRLDSFTFGFWIQPPVKPSPRFVIFHRSKAAVDAGSRGYEVLLENGYISVGLHYLWPAASLKVISREPLEPGQWIQIAVTYDGSSRASGTRIYLNGRPIEVTTIRDNLYKDIVYTKKSPPLTIGQRFRDIGFAGGRIDDFAVFNRELTHLEVTHLAGLPEFVIAWDTPIENLSEAQRSGLRGYYLAHHAEPVIAAKTRLHSLRTLQNQLVMSVPEVMVMEELPVPKRSFILRRGAYDAPGEEVSPDTPAVLPPFPHDSPRNRLGLARWLVDPGNPLFARVAVNRFWQMMFGQGLVETSDNFGLQGSPPTHPQLLDWLAGSFIASGWNVKDLLRRIALSASYRQTSFVSTELRSADPLNLLIGRGPSRRLTAEMLRDQALAASGLLVEKIGGPSVKPYQPPGLWEEIAMGKPTYEQGTGADLYRRSLYTFWKRTVPPPNMMLFDGAERNVCVAKRQITSSPLQALALLNDEQQVECARLLGERLLREGGLDLDARIEWVFELVAGRKIFRGEKEVLLRLYQDQHEAFLRDPAASQDVLKIGQAGGDDALPASDRAAALVIAQALLNCDESLMRR